ncbi:DUF3137 domain-containing protein [Evansella tamaricis]|uniref:DUF3137 domain-containing protein n=1 Tax=Evansella tamaricis TaxID=2069301 RepID=A0ABS6JDT6_9BACI|nr:DUF3137 domain-containing protein [Evansella tamaricis]MBU9710498.1 DUF3137 domain-containing protein [Evansella tamaricis]
MERISKTRNEFDLFFRDKMEGKIDKLDEARRKIRKSRNKYLGISAMGILPALLFAQFFRSFDFVFYIIAIGFGIYGFIKIHGLQKGFSQQMKQEVIKETVKFINPAFKYDPEKFIPKKTFVNTNIFKKVPNRYRGDDYIWGYVYDSEEKTTKNLEPQAAASLNIQNTEQEEFTPISEKINETIGLNTGDANDTSENVPKTMVAFSEVEALHVTKRRDKDGKTKTYEEKIFKGLFFQVDFNKDFKGVTLVLPRQNLLSRFKQHNVVMRHKDLEDLELDHIDFNEQFTVRTTDETKARYILTPAFMEKLLAFVEDTKESATNRPVNSDLFSTFTDQSKGFNVKKRYVPYFSFKNGKMYFLLNTDHKHFDFNLDQKLDRDLLYYYFEDINKSLQLVEELDLNLRLWNKD